MATIEMTSGVAAAYEYRYSDVGLGWREIGGYYKAKHIQDICAANSLKPKNVLDVGAGSGSILHHLAEWDFCDKLYAVDISDGSIETIKGREIPGMVEVSKFDGYHIPYGDKEFDLVILSHVLEHVEHERLLLREIARVSEYQCIEIPIDFNPNIDRQLDHFLSYGHINMYTPQSLRFLMGTEGFELVDDLPDIGGIGMREYQTFVLGKAEDTEEARNELREKIAADRDAFLKLGKRQQYARAHNFTLLSRASADGMKVFSDIGVS